MKSGKITLGRVVVAARRRRGLSQRELAMVLETRMLLRIALYTSRTLGEEFAPGFADLSNRFKFDFRHLSKIENDRVDVRDRAFDCFIYCFAEWADVSVEWLEAIRKQTEIKVSRYYL